MKEILSQKRCSKCGETRDIREFSKNKRNKDGYQAWCKLCRSGEYRKYYRKNKHRLLERFKEYFKKNSEYKKEYDRQHHLNNSEKYRKYSKKYQKENPEKRRALYRERRARLNGAVGGHFTEKEWQQLLDKYGHKCLCCGATDKKLERDHVIPLGPPHSDEISNIQPLCRTCNTRKGRKVIDYRKNLT